MTADQADETSTPASILPLDSAEATLARVGGKGLNLAVLCRAGFEVPPGFIVTTDAYRAFVKANDIEARLLKTAQMSSPDDLAALESSSQEIHALFTAGALSIQLTQQIQAAYANLAAASDGPPAVAVRSSATAEDLPGLSFAGQQDTYLNVIGPEALIEAVKSCWGSLWTARAMSYRARNHIPPDEVALAVVVQVMIPAEVSGILFTANPLTGHRQETVIDASFGLGEAIVSGQVEPDHYVVNMRDMQITARKLGAKALAILPRQEGGTESVTQERQQEQALSDAQILDLARIGTQVADHYGTPQDIEWAWAGGQLYLLQSRPITSLYPVPESLLHADPLRVMFSFNSVQGVVEPLTPLGMDIFPVLISGVLRTAGVRRAARDIANPAGGRLYVDVSGMLRDRQWQRIGLSFFGNIDPGAQQAMHKLVMDGRIETATKRGRRQLLRLIFGFRSVLAGSIFTWLRPEASRRRAIQDADARVAQMQEITDQAETLEARLNVIDTYLSGILLSLIKIIGPVMIPGLLMQAIVGRWLTNWIGAERGAVRRLLRGAPGNPTTEMDLRLWAAAQAIQSNEAARALFTDQSAASIASAYQHGNVPPVAEQALGDFLDTYGMRAVGEIDLGRPRWREDPQAIIQNLSSYVQIDDSTQAPDRLFQQAGDEAVKLAADYIAQVRQQKGSLQARLLAAIIRRMRLLGGMREMPKFYIVKLLDLLRSALLDSGRDLVAQAMLEQAEDIFFLPLDTLRAIASGQSIDLKAIVNQEKADYQRELARQQIPRLLLSTGEVFYQGVYNEGGDDLVGDGVSPGSVEGKVRVVRDPRGVRLEPGEILVCPATDPGWTPLFLSAGGLVMELGGMMTHGSVVAREYGIPAVVGVHEATLRLETGQRVRVDGSAGRVVLLDQEPV